MFSAFPFPVLLLIKQILKIKMKSWAIFHFSQVWLLVVMVAISALVIEMKRSGLADFLSPLFSNPSALVIRSKSLLTSLVTRLFRPISDIAFLNNTHLVSTATVSSLDRSYNNFYVIRMDIFVFGMGLMA